MDACEIITTAGAVSVLIAGMMDKEELGDFIELLGLLRHNLEIFKKDKK